jgi:hypothetical protein
MSTLVTLRTKDGRIINGINYTLAAANIPTNIVTLAAAMQGGMQQGMYHIKTAAGWEYIPASQIDAVLQVKPGVPL